MNVLVLGGTTEARRLVELLAAMGGAHVVVSLAGHTTNARPLPCPVRVGGFDGADGLASHLRLASVDVLVDATHPFSATMPANARHAADLVGIPHLRLSRPPWEPRPGDRWIDSSDLPDARRRLVEHGARRVLLTTGRRDLSPFVAMPGIHFVVRSVEPPDPMPLVDATVIRARGPFGVAEEAELLCAYDIDTVVTRNAGGPDAKLVAARQAGTQVVMVRRPATGAVARASTAAEALDWLKEGRR